jgi:hypothetical protein
MAHVSITRLRLRSVLYELPFIWHAVRSNAQARRAEGCLAIDARRSQGAYWTLTVWKDTAAMRAFMLSGVHRQAMPKLAGWCDEASVGRWEQDGPDLPPWPESEQRMAREGRLTPVAHPSPAQAAGVILGSRK